MHRILLDIGSSTVKAYEQDNGKLRTLGTKSIHFKQDFDPDQGITETNKEVLFDYVAELQKKHKLPIKVYATAIFRKMSAEVQQVLRDDFYRRTGLYFNIVAHDLEGHYLEMALAGKHTADEPLLLINIGGGSTELIVKQGAEVVDRHNLELGVMTVLKDFPYLNEPLSSYKLGDVVAKIKEQLPPLIPGVTHVIYNGGELTYMQLADYELRDNTYLKGDEDHPKQISVTDFAARNREIYESVELKTLEGLMPNDPLWMHGARPCSAIAQAICEHFDVEYIIPSDSNMVHGVHRQEFRSVVLSGSFRKHLDYILTVKKQLTDKGVHILSPRFEEPKNPGEEFVVFDGEEDMSPLELERYHLNMIGNADALVVCAPGGYVGASALIEIGYAQAIGKRIIFTDKPEEFMLNTLPAEIGL